MPELAGFFGITSRGPDHFAHGLPNQDAWIGGKYGSGFFLAVADGLGSRRKSEIASRQACLAVKELLAHWKKYSKAPVSEAFQYLYSAWKFRVSALDAGGTASTCLFAAVQPENKMFLAQLGDGLIVFRKNGAHAVCLEKSPTDFINVTNGLGITNNPNDWKTVEFDLTTTESIEVFLATDGISTEIEQSKIDLFLDHLRDNVYPLPPRTRSVFLRREMTEWSRDGGKDDKTMVYGIWKRKQEGVTLSTYE